MEPGSEPNYDPVSSHVSNTQPLSAQTMNGTFQNALCISIKVETFKIFLCVCGKSPRDDVTT